MVPEAMLESANPCDFPRAFFDDGGLDPTSEDQS